MMSLDEHIEHWLKNAAQDLESSSNMFSAGIYDWCLFVGHLALEKILKALWIKTNNQVIPPKIHNLLKLAELSQLELTEDQKEFLRIVNQFNIEARYQEYKDSFSSIATKEFTLQNLEKIKEVHSWLLSQIK